MGGGKGKGVYERSGAALKIVIKIGGVALEDESTLHKCARAVVEMAKDGHKVAVVHGGGTALTRTLKLLGKQSDFINGLRITDAETRDVAVMVLAGMVNKKVVAAVVKAGLPAVGFCGGDGMTFRARKKETKGYDLGFVGEICSVEPRWFEAIWNEGGVPVLSSLALGSDGEYYNVNADQMASACAIACRADTLIFLTDVAGVKDAGGEVMPWLTTKQHRRSEEHTSELQSHHDLVCRLLLENKNEPRPFGLVDFDGRARERGAGLSPS